MKYINFVLVILIVLFFSVIAFAQTMEDMDWGSLGVDVVVVGFIVGFVQFFKKWLPAKLTWLPMLISMILAMIYALVTNLTMGVDWIIKVMFSYAAYAAWSYEALKNVGILKKKNT